MKHAYRKAETRKTGSMNNLSNWCRNCKFIGVSSINVVTGSKTDLLDNLSNESNSTNIEIDPIPPSSRKVKKKARTENDQSNLLERSKAF